MNSVFASQSEIITPREIFDQGNVLSLSDCGKWIKFKEGAKNLSEFSVHRTLRFDGD